MKKIIYLLLVITMPIFGQNDLLDFKGTNAKNYYEEISFEYIGDKIIIPVKIEGKTYRFLFATGSPCMISKEIYKSIQPKILKQTKIRDANQNSKNTLFTSLEKIEFGAIVFENLPVAVYDFNSVIGINCFNFDGIIGSNLFTNSIFQIDLSQKKIRFGITEDVLLDTGASGFYSLSKRVYNKFFKNSHIYNIIAESTGTSVIGFHGIPSPKKHFKMHINTLKINDFIIGNIITQTDNDEYSKIGVDILKYGIVTLDYKNKKFYLDPKSKIVNGIEPDFGFEPVNKANKLIIGFVWDDELKKKISYGDEIIEINGKKTPPICDLLLNKPFEKENQLKLKIKTKKGEILDLIVKKHFPKISK